MSKESNKPDKLGKLLFAYMKHTIKKILHSYEFSHYIKSNSKMYIILYLKSVY